MNIAYSERSQAALVRRFTILSSKSTYKQVRLLPANPHHPFLRASLIPNDL